MHNLKLIIIYLTIFEIFSLHFTFFQYEKDIQQTAIDGHHQRQAEQITGATPFHLQKGGDKQSPQVQTVQIATSTGQQAQIITRFPSNVIQAKVDKYIF